MSCVHCVVNEMLIDLAVVGMMPGILEMLENVAKSKGIVWADKLHHWKEEGQWHVEVY